MDLDEQVEAIEELGETEAEWTDQETELEDVQSEMDEYLGEDAMGSDMEHAYGSFITNNEANYNGYDPSAVEDSANAYEAADILHSEGYHEEGADALEEEVIEMEIEDGDIYAYLVDEDDNEIGFVLLDEDGNEQEYYYVDMSEYEFVDEVDGAGATGAQGAGEGETRVVRAEDGEQFDIGLSREAIAEATDDINAIYKEGAAVAAELKDALGDISQTFGGSKRRR